jgi:putative NIF3 family GTP cyclohydrolase 1 type 2
LESRVQSGHTNIDRHKKLIGKALLKKLPLIGQLVGSG